MPTAKAPKEGDIVKVIRQYLELRGAVVVRNNSGGLPDATGRVVRFGEPGSADLLVCFPTTIAGSLVGRYVAVEVKGPRGRLRPSQSAWLDLVRSAGGLAFVVRSLEQLIAALAEIGL